ncbi:MAG: BatA domain-containing protein [Chlorobiales bacterium]
MTLLHPIYLWSLFLLIIPIAVHLFSKNNPPRIKVGSVKFLEQAESRTLRRIKFHDALLFVLRAIIFFLLSMLVASPEIACKNKASETGWILIDPNISLEEQPAEFHRTIDSLLKRGYEMRFLEPDFPKSSSTKEENKIVDIWSLLAEADKINSDTLAFYVASPLRENTLQGKRPMLGREVKWIEVSSEETAWIERIAQLSNDSLFIAIGMSSPNETRFEYLFVPMPDKTTLAPPIELTKIGDSIGVSLISKPNQIKWLVCSRQQSWCIIYDEHFANMLPYFERAVTAVAQFSPIKISVRAIKQSEWRQESEAQIIWLCKSEPFAHPKLLDVREFMAESLLDENFIHRLSEALLPESVSDNDSRKASSSMATPTLRHERKASEEKSQSLIFPIWILVTLLVGIERWIAFSRE